MYLAAFPPKLHRADLSLQWLRTGAEERNDRPLDHYDLLANTKFSDTTTQTIYKQRLPSYWIPLNLTILPRHWNQPCRYKRNPCLKHAMSLNSKHTMSPLCCIHHLAIYHIIKQNHSQASGPAITLGSPCCLAYHHNSHRSVHRAIPAKNLAASDQSQARWFDQGLGLRTDRPELLADNDRLPRTRWCIDSESTTITSAPPPTHWVHLILLRGWSLLVTLRTHNVMKYDSVMCAAITQGTCRIQVRPFWHGASVNVNEHCRILSGVFFCVWGRQLHLFPPNLGGSVLTHSG